MSSIHDIVEPWWTDCDERPLKRGQLVHAFVPHVGVSPYVFDVEGRAEPTEHRSAMVKIRALNVRDRHKRPVLPVAALPQNPGEVWTAHRSKVRPCLVVSVGGDEVPRELRPQSSPRWQTVPTILVAPYYGAGQTTARAGWHQPFLDRVRCCEYPQFLLDSLPIPPNVDSILRLDHVQPIGRHYHSYSALPHALSQDALDVIDEWLAWLTTGVLSGDAVLSELRRLLQEELR